MKFSTFLMIAIALAIGYGVGWYGGKGGSFNFAALMPQAAPPAATPGAATATVSTTTTTNTANLAPPPPSQVPSSQATVMTATQISDCKNRCGTEGVPVCYRGSARINACQARCEGARDQDLLDTTCNLPRG